MIETHIVNALLRPDLKEQAAFKVLTFVNGLVAPGFLFCAGFALAITLHRRWNDYVMMRQVFRRYLMRLLFIWLVGYSLHLPFFSLRRLWGLTDSTAWMSFFQVDILQTIASTLLAMLLLAVVSRRPKIFLWLASAITLLIIISSPIVRSMDWSGLPIWIRPYLTTQFKSQFPLFPWAAFVSAGTILGFWYLRLREAGDESAMGGRLSLIAVGAILLSIALEYLPVSIYPHHDFWAASPEFFFVRCCLILLAASGLWRFESSSGAGRSVISLFGQESLLVYVVHLLVVYGYTYDWSFIRMFGPTLRYDQCGALFVGLTGAMWLMAYAWHALKAWSATNARIVQFATLGGILLTFILRAA